MGVANSRHEYILLAVMSARFFVGPQCRSDTILKFPMILSFHFAVPMAREIHVRRFAAVHLLARKSR